MFGKATKIHSFLSRLKWRKEEKGAGLAFDVVCDSAGDITASTVEEAGGL